MEIVSLAGRALHPSVLLVGASQLSATGSVGLDNAQRGSALHCWHIFFIPPTHPRTFCVEGMPLKLPGREPRFPARGIGDIPKLIEGVPTHRDSDTYIGGHF